MSSVYKFCSKLFCIAGISLPLFALSQSNHITVDADSVLNRIPSTLFGTCIEDVNHEIYGGLYDQKIMGESFEEPASGINYTVWEKHGGYWAADREYNEESISIIPGRRTRRMVAKNDLDVEPDGSAKLVYQPLDFTNGLVEVSLRFLQARGNGASILLRVSNAGIGENALEGYEIRLSREEGKIKLIRHQRDYRLLAEKAITFPVDQWNRLRINAIDGHIIVYVNDMLHPALEYIDTQSPIQKGKVGLCTAGSPVSFRDMSLKVGNKLLPLSLVRPANQQVSDRWDPIQTANLTATFSLQQQDAFNGLAAQTVSLLKGNGRAGVANLSLNRWGIAIGKGQTMKGTCYLQAVSGPLPVMVALENVDGSVTYAKQIINARGNNWKEYSFSLTSSATDTNARFAIYIIQPGKLRIDQVTLMSAGTQQFKGLPMRADIGNGLMSEGLTFMRYAGTMVNADGYRFKKMIGDRAKRIPYTGHWNEFSTNGFGIEDFLQYCEAAQIPAAFAINIEETAQDAADMVEYLNGDISTTWGKKRAENGHAKPYQVKYIEIGNEEVLFEGDNAAISDHYIERFNDLYQAIHTKDTAINLVCSVWWRPESSNTEKVFKALDGKAAYWDYHVGGDDASNGLNVDKELTRMRKLFYQWNPSTTMKCAIFEENGGLHNMQRALGHATNLNAVRRHGDFVLTSCPANALQPYLQNDNSWDQGQIFFTPTKVWGMPPFYAQQMASRSYQPLRIKESVDGKLDVTATKSEDGKTLVLHVVNTASTSQKTALQLEHFLKSDEVKAWTLTGDLHAENLPGNTEAISTKESVVVLSGDKMEYDFPAYSYTILQFQKK